MRKKSHSDCSSGKVKHPSKTKAESAAVRMFLRRGATLRVYKCPECHHWHLTSKNTERLWFPISSEKTA